MADLYQITIDIEAVRRRLSAAEGREWTANGVRTRLLEVGFAIQGDGRWICDDALLAMLDASDITDSEILG